MLQLLILFRNIMKKGEKKGELNTVKKRIKFLFRTILTFNSSMKLGSFILNHKYLKDKIYSYPILISKIHRPYLQKNIKISNKLETIINTYNIIDKIFNKNIIDELYLNGQSILSTIIGREKNVFYISLELYPFFDKEGEINLKLLDKNRISLATLTFSFFKDTSSKIILFIGGIQGAPKEIEKDYIKQVTKELYGIFPKKLLIESLYIIEKALNLSIEKFSVGNQTHVYKAQRYVRKRVIHSDYDSFLCSLESEKLKNNIWKLPVKLNKKNIDDIPSKKRGQYLKKIILIENIEKQIILKLQSI